MKSTSSNGAQYEGLVPKELILPLVISCIACLITFFFLYQQGEEDPFIQKTLNLSGSIENGSQLYRMNCVGCHGISAQGLVGPRLNKVTEEHTDTQIIKQVIQGLTPPMPSFDIDPQSMADLLKYLHSLKD